MGQLLDFKKLKQQQQQTTTNNNKQQTQKSGIYSISFLDKALRGNFELCIDVPEPNSVLLIVS